LGSLTPDPTGASLNVGVREIEVPADTLDRIERLAAKPQYVSFECDLTRRRRDTLAALDRLGYHRFKLVTRF